jgi:DNA-binding LacI/PurR family transcriptional regulator
MATIDEVATQAAVSKSTVSRAFSRPGSVNAATRARILEAASIVGYQPRNGVSLASRRRTGNVGLIVPDVGNPYFQPLLKAVQHEAVTQQYPLFMGAGENDPQAEAEIARSMAHHVDGLLLASSRMEEGDIIALAAELPVVVVNREIAGIPSVSLASGEGMAQAVEHLVALGHRRIAYLSGPPRFQASVERLDALRTVVAQLKVEVVELGPFQPSFESGQRATDLVMSTSCTAVIAFNDLTALGLMARAAELDIVVGRDLSVIGFDGLWLAATSNPPLTTVAAPVGEAGTFAARELFKALSGQSAGGHRRLGADLIVRSSTGPAVPHTPHWKASGGRS